MKLNLNQLETAFHWLCRQRKQFPANADIWSFRLNYPCFKNHLLKRINQGNYRFSVQHKINKADGSIIHLWSSQDAMVMKLLADQLQGYIQPSRRCTHVKDHGGLKQTIVDVQNHLDDYQFVCKTDIHLYYESINQYLLVDMIADHVDDSVLRYYLYQIIHRTVEYGGLYIDIEQGISRGCPLSPLLGALYLKGLDQWFAGKDLFYVRYMDDILIMTQTRWQNRKAVKQLNQILNRLKLKKHPDKTFIGRISKGFDFLGYHFSRKHLSVASKTVNKHVLHYIRLYEQLRKKKAASDEIALSLELYAIRWQRWVTAGLQTIKIDVSVSKQYRRALLQIER